MVVTTLFIKPNLYGFYFDVGAIISLIVQNTVSLILANSVALMVSVVGTISFLLPNFF
jgi:hypothetical protein